VTTLIETSLAVVPILLFLSALFYLDSFRLVRVSAVAAAITVGCSIAFICLFLNQWLVELLGMEASTYTRYGGPVLEETLKATYVVFLIRCGRADFLVDSAIYGFAVGGGFAVVENLYYLQTLSDPHVLVWVIRGFGTAGIHGAATSVFGILSASIIQQRKGSNWLVFVPPLVVAVLLHSLFNHFILSPELTTVWIVFLLPVLVVVVYGRSEQATREWLGIGIDTEMELLEEIMSHRISESKVGRYLQTLRDRFPGETVADMLCFLRIHLELSIGAKGILLMQGAGLKVHVDPEIRAKLDELKFLEKSLGKTGRLAMQPFLRLSRRELWQLYMLHRL
jgi:RsiW-degrading membrane proteinase PrsW (M82 family)